MTEAQTDLINKHDLIVPIYIDTSTLLDLLASIEDGFSVTDEDYDSKYCY